MTPEMIPQVAFSVKVISGKQVDPIRRGRVIVGTSRCGIVKFSRGVNRDVLPVYH